MPGSALIGNLAVNLSLETAAFQQGASIAEKRLQAFGDKLGKVGQNIAKAGLIMTAGITTPLAAFGKQAFNAAKDAAELDAAFGETFGKMAGSMDQWAVATGNAMGRSTREIKEGANTFGLYFNQAAKTREEAAKMSQTFTVLAQDLASFHNTSVGDAILALRSGLSGEAEPMRKFGVFLSEAAVNAKAAELGIGALGQKLTDEEKIAARYAIIMEKTASAQGDVARTSGSTANQIREAEAAWEELQITVGTKLLPALTPLITSLGNILEKFNQLSPTTQTWIVGIGATAAALGPLMLALGPLIIGVGKLLPLLTALGPAFVAVRVAMLALLTNPVFLGAAVAIGAIYLAWQNWDKIGPIVSKMADGVIAGLNRLAAPFKWVIGQAQTVTAAFFKMYDRVVGHSYVPDMVDGIAQQMSRLQEIMVDPALSATEKVGQAFQSLSGLIGDLFGQKAGGIIGAIGNLALALAPLFGGSAKPGSFTAGAENWIGPRMAKGGSGTFGGLSGVDRNVLSLNGSPIARVSKGEHFRVSPNDHDRGMRVQVVPSPYFDVVVDDRASRVAAPMAGQAAIMGAAGAHHASFRQQRRMIP